MNRRTRRPRYRTALGQLERAVMFDEPVEGEHSPWLLMAWRSPRHTACAAVWERARPGVLAEYVRVNPGRRPDIWWRLDAPEPRRQIAGPELRNGVRHRTRHGVPLAWEPGPRQEGLCLREHYDPDNPPVYESQAEFLKRHGLLLDGEAGLLADADFEPQPFFEAVTEACWYDEIT